MLSREQIEERLVGDYVYGALLAENRKLWGALDQIHALMPDRNAGSYVEGVWAIVGRTRSLAPLTTAEVERVKRLERVEEAAKEAVAVASEDWPMFRANTGVPADWYRCLMDKLDALAALADFKGE